MVDFLKDLPKKFRERFLNTHEKYLRSFRDIARTLYFKGSDSSQACKTILDILSKERFSEPRLEDKSAEESLYFRNLRNSWYHELASSYPLDYNERMLFAPWKIIQCYYTVYSGISALLRCFDKSLESPGHTKGLNIFANQFLLKPDRKMFFLPPYNLILTSKGEEKPPFVDSIGYDMLDIQKLRDCLESAKGNIKFFVHYLKELREWINYEDSYLFFRLYGDAVKRHIDSSLFIIQFGYLVQIEYFMLNLFGWEALEIQFNNFKNQVIQNLGIQPVSLCSRFSIYEKLKF